MKSIIDILNTSAPPIDTQIILWTRGKWLIGSVFISKKGKRLFSDGGFPVGDKSRWALLPDLSLEDT